MHEFGDVARDVRDPVLPRTKRSMEPMLTARFSPPSIQATKTPQRSPVELPLMSHQVSTRLAVNATGTVHPDHGRAILGCGLYLIYG